MTESDAFRLVVRSVGFVLFIAGVFEGVSTAIGAWTGEWKYLSSDVIQYKLGTTAMCLGLGLAVLVGSGAIVRLIYRGDLPRNSN